MTATASFRIKADTVAFRRATFFGAILATTGLGAWLLWGIFLPEGISALEWIQLVLFVLLFQQVATGFWLAMFGFITTLAGGDKAQIARSIDAEDDPLSVATAVVVPIFNEDVERVFAGIEAVWNGLDPEGAGQGIDIFILSDSNKPENWLKEELAWFELCRRKNAFGRIHYRKRRTPRNGKSGNVADFCRRWGARYRYMIVFDADSIMTGRLLRRLVVMMEKNPRVGLIQTAPQLVMGRTLFRRMQQFASKLYAPLFAAGSNYWHLFGANYWGHNAIIRVQPFITHCDLPELPDPDAKRRHIFSHDTVEAALMRKAGYDVWFAYAEEGSYEEGPPNLSDSLGRDRRWCMGNLQHFWFLFAPGIDFANRFHIWMGVMGYCSSALWLLFLVIGAVDLAVKHRFSLLSALPVDGPIGGAVPLLFLATLGLLFVPKILSLLVALPKAGRFGGVLRMTVSVLLETVIWTLLAPVMMIYYTRFVFLTMAGLQVKWGGQNRDDDKGLGLGTSFRIFWLPPVLGIMALIVLWNFAPQEIVLLSPVLLGWLLAPLIAWLTSQAGLGDWCRRRRLFLIPEEQPGSAPMELEAVQNHKQSRDGFPDGGLVQTVGDPVANAVHVSLLRQRGQIVEDTAAYLSDLREKLLTAGPDSLSTQQKFALLWDAESMFILHRELWGRSSEKLHEEWRRFLATASPQGA
jgi:membrane glycosyltransferase